MGTGYTRNDTSNNIADGNIINASDLDGEFNAIESAMGTSGHTHDGTSAEGGPVTVIGPIQDFIASGTAFTAKGTGYDLGSTGTEFEDLFLTGKAYIDGFGESTLFDTTSKIQFRDSALFINSSADGQLDLEADTTIELTAPTVALTNDLKLQSDAAVLTFGEHDEVTVTHVHNTGLDVKAAGGIDLNLQTSETSVETGNVLGKITFNSPNEGAGSSAVVAGAAIEAVAEATFASSNNSSALVFKTNTNGAATERMRLTSAGDLHFLDSRKAIFGAGSDLSIYHDGTRSYVDETGAGSLWIRGGDVAIKSTASETMAEFANNGAVTLYYDNAAKIATSNTGVTVSGVLINNGNIEVSTGGPSTYTDITDDDAGLIVGSSSASVAGLAIRTGTSGVGSIYFADNSGSADSRKAGSIKFDHSTDDMTIQAEDDLRLYAKEDMVMRGTTYTFDSEGGAAEFMKIDTNGQVGIGISSVIGKLHVNDGSGATLTLTRTSGATSGTLGKLRFGNTNVDSALASIVAIQDGATDNSAITFGTQSSGAAEVERMRIKSTGEILHTLPSEDTTFAAGTDSTWNRLEIFQDRGAANTASGIAFRSNSGTAPAGIVGVALNTTGGREELAFITATGNASSEAMRIDENGNVGIGGTPNVYTGYTSLTLNNATNGGILDLELNGTVTGELFVNSSGFHLYAPTSDDDITFRGNDGGSGQFTALTLDMSQAGEADFNSAIKVSNQIVAHQTNKGVLEYNSNITRLRSYGASSGTGELRFQTGGGGGSADSLAMTIDNSGRVIMGTATDSNAHANADNLIIGNVPATGVDAGLTIVSGNDANGAIHFSDGTSSGNANIQGQIVYAHTDNALSVYTATALAMKITSAGRVGITEAPEFSTTFKSLELGPTALVSANNTNGRMVTNVYYDGNYKRKTDGVSLQYEQDNAGHIWYFDASGTADAAFTQSEVARLNTSGHFVLGGGGNVVLNDGAGIDFSATANGSGGASISELLDDYEEGYVGITITCSGGGTITLDSSSDSAYYTKIGRLVTVGGRLEVDSVSSPTGHIYIRGLPYTALFDREAAGQNTASGIVYNPASDLDGQLAIEMTNTYTTSLLVREGGGQAAGVTTMADKIDGGSLIAFTVTYVAA